MNASPTVRVAAGCGLALALLLAGSAVPAHAQTFSDPAFSTEVVTTLPPFTLVGLAWAPDGRMFIWQKNGIVRVFHDGVLHATPFIDLSSQVNTFDDRGMWGLAFDPEFETNGYVYLSYVYEEDGNANDASPKTARLVRVTADPVDPDVALPGSLVVILGSIPSEGGGHTLGTIRFAADGTMFVGHGDGADAAFADPLAFRAQDLDAWNGKILRINRDGSAPGDNPFDDGTDSIRSKVWAYGLRNPFRFSLHPVTGVPYAGDVGWNDWEEIDRVGEGENLGWPCYEGTDAQPVFDSQFSQCAGLDPVDVVAPLFDYDRTLGTSVIGGPFYTGTVYPQLYQGNLFFTDYTGGWVRRMQFDAQGEPTGVQVFATGLDSPVTIEQGPDGMLYYLSFATGQVRRIRHSGPTAMATATPAWGYSPLAVQFSSAGSSSGGTGQLTYTWDFGDGTSSTAANPAHTYANPGVRTYLAKLTVRTQPTVTSTAEVKVTVGSMPPSPTITAPSNGTAVMPGQVVAYAGQATDPDQGALPPSALSWLVLLHHNTHVHTFVGGTGASGSFVAANHGAIGTYSYEIRLTATDSSGLEASTSVMLPVVGDGTAPSAPQSLVAVPLDSTRVELSWYPATDNGGIGQYEVERCQGIGCASFALVGSTGATELVDTGLTGNTTYRYRVRARDASGNAGAYSNVATTTTPLPPPGAPGLRAGFAFEEGSGSSVADSSGNGNVGTILGAAWTTQGKFGKALSFNGVSSRVSIAASSSLNVTGGTTLMAWVYPTASQTGWRTILQRQAEAYFLNASHSAGTLRPSGGGTFGGTVDYVGSASSLPLNTWTHVAMTYDGSAILLYVNGSEVAAQGKTGSIQTNSNPLWIGGNSPYGEYFAGRIDDVRVYDRALAPSAIQVEMSRPVDKTGIGEAPLLSARKSGTSIDLRYTPACGATDHTLYRGTSPIGAAASWSQATCGIGNSGLVLFNPGTPPVGQFFYFVVVGRDASNEGSYGKASSGAERPEATGLAACDLPRTLGGSCF